MVDFRLLAWALVRRLAPYLVGALLLSGLSGYSWQTARAHPNYEDRQTRALESIAKSLKNIEKWRSGNR